MKNHNQTNLCLSVAKHTFAIFVPFVVSSFAPFVVSVLRWVLCAQVLTQSSALLPPSRRKGEDVRMINEFQATDLFQILRAQANLLAIRSGQNVHGSVIRRVTPLASSKSPMLAQFGCDAPATIAI